jgi:hypothetical protein
VIHVHSRHSDGTGTVAEIVRAAERAGADAVILTDHDTLRAEKDGETGRRGSVLVLAGHEITPPRRNHMLAFGTPNVIPWKGRTPAQIAEAVRAEGGLGVAAHPFSRGSHRFRRIGSLGHSMHWEDLECVDGLEVWSFLADHGQALESVREAVSFIRRPERHLVAPPQRNLDEWDRLCARRRVVGIGGLDAHQFGVRIGGRVLRAMGYHRTFRQLRTHVLAREPDRDGVFEALREGRCFIAANVVAPAYGFRFYGLADDGQRLEMGAQAGAGSWGLHVELPVSADVRLLRDGKQVAATSGDELVHRAGGPGVYRVEVRRDHLDAQRVWILSNPVYLR